MRCLYIIQRHSYWPFQDCAFGYVFLIFFSSLFVDKTLIMAGKGNYNYSAVSGPVVLKVRMGDDVRRIPNLNEDLTFDELVLMLNRIYRSRLAADDELTVKYLDEGEPRRHSDRPAAPRSNPLAFFSRKHGAALNWAGWRWWATLTSGAVGCSFSSRFQLLNSTLSFNS